METKNQIIKLNEIEESQRTPAQQEALFMHQQIILHINTINQSLYGICYTLKVINDKKLYVELGYKSLGEYADTEFNIGERQAYYYISLLKTYGAEFLQSNAKIGITKLLQIASLDFSEREKLLEENSAEELAEMSTVDVKELVAELAKTKEQLSFLQDNPVVIEKVVEKEVEQMSEKDIEAKAKEIFKVDIDKFCKEISDLKKDKKEAEDKAKAHAKARDDAQKAANDAKEKAKEASKAIAEAATLRAQLEAANAKTKAAEAKIRESDNPELTRFKIMYTNVQKDLTALVEQLEKLDGDIKANCIASLQKFIAGVQLA